MKKKAKTFQSVGALSKPHETKGNIKLSQKLPKKLRKVAVPKSKVKLLIPPPLPEPPPSRSKELAGPSFARVPFGAVVAVEERNLAPESCKSQITSTSNEQTKHRKTISEFDFKGMPWEPPKDERDTRVKDSSRNEVHKTQVKLLITPLLPEPPPRHWSKEAPPQGAKILPYVDEERKLALESLKSQCASTSATKATNWCLPMQAVKKTSWEPPPTLRLAERKSCRP